VLQLPGHSLGISHNVAQIPGVPVQVLWGAMPYLGTTQMYKNVNTQRVLNDLRKKNN
jgi:hypothetical protein